ncbi:hypothetical protein [Flagellimonas algicola]|uniref:Uncharacterized protein n=1 Tax=Flagellimonas algicola TaxID=2583815 RepID=A0ABY2WQI8_9FLAO|nr:hypothetical protein [Allomuricauda algicola]TMU56916.1 hypothetical protein FGG15_05050 [Allomuricauda algicola]
MKLQKVRTKRHFRFLGIGLTVLILCGYALHRYHTQKKVELAYQQTAYALGLLSENLNKGFSKMGHLNQFERTKRKIYKY